MKNDTAFTTILSAVMVLIVLFCCTILPVIRAKMESATYNKLTGAHTTTWDALWVELRVQDTPSISR